ncbi:chlorite dismutase family protein [Aquabacter sp. CN5-332]|uniref:chlorite dismutase family protein n=1 Tax=Aquabacter sp. CN5-332 TaxID=3156608 RepID=UPI0032B4FBE3
MSGVASISQPPLLVAFSAGASGPWRIDRITPVVGESLAFAPRLMTTETPIIDSAALASQSPGGWTLRGATSNTRYTSRSETNALAALQQGLGRRDATRAALIPVRKTPAWWNLAQDERRAILEEQSHHIEIGLGYLPAIARRLHHSRELGEPFDFLTWFEYAPQDANAFEELVDRLRLSPEWTFVDREVDIRLSRP